MTIMTRVVGGAHGDIDDGDRDVIGTVGEGMGAAALNWARIVGCNGEVCAGGVAGCDPEWRCC